MGTANYNKCTVLGNIAGGFGNELKTRRTTMAFNIPTIKIPEIKIPEVKIDTAAFNKIHAQAAATVEQGNKISLVSQLTPLKMKTIHTPLTAADREVATEVVHKLAVNGWLSESDIAWCQTQEIPVL